MLGTALIVFREVLEAALIVGIVAVIPTLWSSWPLWGTFLGWSIGGLGMALATRANLRVAAAWEVITSA